jgi:hypothetical protein
MQSNAINLQVAARLAATTTSAAVDLSDYTGEVLFVLNASVTEAADNTADVKLQHCDTSGGSYVDSGIAFTQVTNAAASFQTIKTSVDGLKQFVKVVSTLAGTTPKCTLGVSMFGRKAY